MLYKLHTNIFIIGFLTFCVMAGIAYQKAFALMTVASLVGFVTQMALLISFSKDEKMHCSEKLLFITVLVYMLFMSFFYMCFSEYYDGDNFMFSKDDAMFYYKESMRVVNMGLVNGIGSIVKTFAFDDCGALIYDGVMMYLIPNKLFINLVNIVLGAISSVFLYRIGRPFMPDLYAFMAALAYGSSSYLVFFHCSFLKESLFVFLVINVMYFQYKAIAYNSNQSLIGVAFFLFLIMFFRPAVAAFLIMSIAIYYAIKTKGHAISLFLYIVAAVGFAISLKSMQEIVERNTLGGDIDAVVADTNNAAYSSSFNYFVSFFGAIFGPFPSLFPKPSGPSYMEFLSAGLVYKLFLVMYFWLGIYSIIKKYVVELFPLALFILIEMLLTGAVCASLELRKVLLHVPFMYIIAFYGIYKVPLTTRLNSLPILAFNSFVVGVLFLWNVLKVKN